MVFVNLHIILNLRIRIFENGVLLLEQAEQYQLQVSGMCFLYPRGGLVEQWAVVPTAEVERELLLEVELSELLYLALGFDDEVRA